MPHNPPPDRKVPHKKSGPPRAGGPRKPARHAKAASAPTAEAFEPRTTERIAKVMARAGACSRRDAEAWIEEGRVAVNGEVLRDPAVNVGESDAITIDGSPLPHRAKTRLFRFHKPRGLVTTEHDPEGRTTIFDHLREHWPDGSRVVSVGRLDINTEGLMLLTNDGGLARVLELPATGWVRRYRVRVNGETDQATLDRLQKGITIDDVSYAGIEATLDRVQGANSWLTMSLREGKNREIKRVLEPLGLAVNRLIRLSFGPFQLGELAEGAVEEVRTKVLRDQLGPSLAKAAGADFTSPSEAEPESASPPAAATRHQPERRTEPDRRPSDGVRPRQMSKEGPRPRKIPRAAGSRKAEAPAPAKVKPVARVRKHVSVLRRQEAEVQAGPRKRIERAETADRSGRVVAVERVVAVAAKPAEEKAKTRNGRRFEALRKGPEDAPARKPRGATNRASSPRPDGHEARDRSFAPRGSTRPGAGKPESGRGQTGERSRQRFERPKGADGSEARRSRPDAPEARNRSFPQRTSAKFGAGKPEAGRGETGERSRERFERPKGGHASRPRPDAHEARDRSFAQRRSAKPGAGKPDAGRAEAGERPSRQRFEHSPATRAPGRVEAMRPSKTGEARSASGGSERARERPKGAAGGQAAGRSEKHAPAKTRTDGVPRGAGVQRKPASKPARGGGHAKGRTGPGSPPRKT